MDIETFKQKINEFIKSGKVEITDEQKEFFKDLKIEKSEIKK